MTFTNSFLNPSMLVDLYTKQSPPPYSRLLWVPAPSSPPRGVIRPPLPPCWVGSPHLRAQFPCCRPLPANMKGPGIEKQNPSRGARRLPPSRRFKLQSLGMASNETYLLKVRSFLANAPNVIATLSGKQTHSEGQHR